MEKVLLVTGIWAICVLCAVLFVRGAASLGARRDAASKPMHNNDTATDAARR